MRASPKSRRRTLPALERHLVAAPDHRLQVLALEQLHDDVGAAVFLTHAVDVDDVGVVQGGGDAGLADESLTCARIVAQVSAHDLDGDLAERIVVGTIHDARRALADHLEVGVLAQFFHVAHSRRNPPRKPGPLI